MTAVWDLLKHGMAGRLLAKTAGGFRYGEAVAFRAQLSIFPWHCLLGLPPEWQLVVQMAAMVQAVVGHPATLNR